MQGVFSYLKSYSFEPAKIDRLIVSAFLNTNKLSAIKNELLQSLIIQDSDVDYPILQEFLKRETIKEFEQLVQIFEFVISPEDKKITGAVYTPNDIRKFIISNTFESIVNPKKIKICDPACGCSGFLYNAAKELKKNYKLSYKEIYKNNIFGLDIQEYSVTRSKILLSLLAIVDGEDETNFAFNIFNGNALNFDWSSSIQDHDGFDIVIGNPPYVCSRNIDDTSKVLLSNWSVCTTGHPDLYIPFFEIGLSILKPNGVLGYITMNSFFKSLNGRALRSYFKEQRPTFKIIDFGGLQVFLSKSTYTCICLIHKNKSEEIEYIKVNNLSVLRSQNLNFKQIPYENLDSKGGWNLQETEVLTRIENSGKPLGDLFTTRNGIATLKNDIFIFKPVKKNKKYFFLKTKEGVIHRIERGACTEIVNPNKLTKIDSLRTLKEKIIFPYHFKNDEVNIIAEEKFKKRFPKAYEYLETKKLVLATRDKGKGKYGVWYAYGRNQSLEKFKFKLFFPHIIDSTPNFVISTEETLLFYNGIAIIGKTKKELQLLQKLLSTRLFWFYIKHSSKPYGSNYYSLSKNYIRNFGILDFTSQEVDRIIRESSAARLNNFIERRYGIDLSGYKM